jgi:enoyl-CoA hydratase/carnithine racemase
MFYVADEILVEKLGPVTTVGINIPQKRNCINQATATKLSQAILKFEEDDSAVVGVLHGIGGNFCAGYDLEELSGFDTDMKLDNKAGHGPMVSSCITDFVLS